MEQDFINILGKKGGSFRANIMEAIASRYFTENDQLIFVAGESLEEILAKCEVE